MNTDKLVVLLNNSSPHREINNHDWFFVDNFDTIPKLVSWFRNQWSDYYVDV